MTDIPMRDKWAEAFAETAAAWWTPQRTLELTGGKNFAVLPGEAPVLLRALGLLHRDGSMPPAQVRKYRQINHMVAVLGPSLRELRERFEEVTLIDAGCGRSYLTVLLAWCFVHRYRHPVKILGIDHNDALIEECRRRTRLTGLEKVLRYQSAKIAGLDLAAAWSSAFEAPVPQRLHGLISLHACDTATDDALAAGISQGTEFIAVAPCCQAELAARWAELDADGEVGAFATLWASPHMRRTVAAPLTDAMRMQLLRAAGYETSAIEFVPSAHTPKNTLIRAMRRGGRDDAAWDAYLAMRDASGGVGIALENALGHR